ncbi:meiotically up-regulated gene 157 (Mug157) protein [Paenibacillus sp. W4I10]|uniref:glycoside hydrolase family 125 protein n=1 Tax=Paenibacillus sp. W4I10 TaxID=3042298 RepID=UPI00277FD10D|nr:glycoside hydrolase family 125 protein [Paenibacillus sp. W4I10]MDQ0720697.1 meiotically up-regulated gene 157 (Mug157) protein [Paenibacillus sp. W4I10]
MLTPRDDQEISPSIYDMIDQVNKRMPDHPELNQMFKNCFTNTMATTIQRKEDGTTFVITGDIPAMWLRDSAAQVRPYLVLASEDEDIADMIAGLVERQLNYILLDPYANAFNETESGKGHQEDLTQMNDWIWERKYEIDSLAYPIQLSYLLWKNTGRTTQFNNTFRKAAQIIMQLWQVEQHHETKSPYTFQRLDAPETDTLSREGRGTETVYTGMTWSGFRPSDDRCEYGYLIPSNMFAVVALRYLQEIAEAVFKDETLAATAQQLEEQINKGIQDYGTVEHPEYGTIYAYETDGKGNHNLMDDANVPSLLSLPYLGYVEENDEVYQNTRRFILSTNNPYFYEGTAAAGIGSPHTPEGYIWHIALSMQGLTTADRNEKLRLLQLIQQTDAGTGLTHEGFSANNPHEYTRPWFSWSNMLFSELMMDYCGFRVQK